jgi:hypothetical protein
MPRLGFFTAAAASALLLAGCATLGVSAHVDRTFDFNRPHTYEWGPADALPTGDPRLDGNEFFDDYFRGAVERGFALKGVGKATSEPPDLLIHYHASVTREIDVAAIEREYSNCYGKGCYPSVIDFENGTLMIDVMDARTNRLVWRSWAQGSVAGVINDQDRLRKMVNEAVESMMEKWPAAL